MTLLPDTKKQLIEARERIKEQIFADESLGGYKGGPPDLRGVYAALKEELRQISEILGPDPNDQGDLYQGAAADAADADDEAVSGTNTDANIFATRIVVDDAARWDLSRIALIAALVAVGSAIAVAIPK